MVNKKKIASSEQKNLDEVMFSDQLNEFSNFFKEHRLICDKLTGLKYHNVTDLNMKENKVISEDNFIFGIRLLQSFAYQYLYGIKDKRSRIDIQNSLNKFQLDFKRDKEYELLLNKYINNNIGEESYLTFKRKYYAYLLKAFEIVYSLGVSLQQTLNVATRDIKKIMRFYVSDEYYKSMSDYRTEVSSVISDFSYIEMERPIKKVLGYYYTYKYIFNTKNRNNLDVLMSKILGYYLRKETIFNIYKIKNNPNGNYSDIEEESLKLQSAIAYAYFLCNKTLSDRNILPKIYNNILIDKSLI